MVEREKTTETGTVADSARPSFRDIKPQSDITPAKANAFLENLTLEKPDRNTQNPLSYKDMLIHTPKEGERGHWEGKPGESKYIPSLEKGEAVQQKLAEKGLDGIVYRNGEPDFSRCAVATVTIDHMTENRGSTNGIPGNFRQADTECAKQWNADKRDERTNWTAAEVRDWRRENGCTWHERCDTETMNLVPQEIHSYFTHCGGCAVCKARDAALSSSDMRKEDEFDD